MDRLAFANLLRQAIFAACDEFIRAHPTDHPYAFALIGGQAGNYLGYAVATEEGLRQVASEYETRGYRYQGWEWEEFDNREKLANWLRWANPDDGWLYGDFPGKSQIQTALAQIVTAGELGQDAIGIEEFCTDVLTTLQQETAWKSWTNRVVVGFTCGEDPRDFLRTATRANPYPMVQKLWQEYRQGDELSRRIPAPK